MKTAVIIGKFYPLHDGHIDMIESALREMDKVYVLVCTNSTQTWNNLTPEERTTAVVYGMNYYYPELTNKLEVHNFDDSDMPDSQESDSEVSKTWAKFLVNRFPDMTHFYGSEPYIKMMADHENKEYVLIDRKINPISGTMCRNETTKYFVHLSPYIKLKAVKRICIVGAESSGKSTLAYNLKEHYKGRTTLIQESGRMLMSQPKLNRNHFIDFGLKQFSNIFLNDFNCQRPYQIIDTDVGITNLYCHEYLNLGYELDVLQTLRAREKYDFYLVLSPDVKFVQDGMRIQEDQEKRVTFFKKVLDYVEKSGVPFKVIYQSDYDERFRAATQILETLFDIKAD